MSYKRQDTFENCLVLCEYILIFVLILYNYIQSFDDFSLNFNETFTI
jgi:hypothetical protein